MQNIRTFKYILPSHDYDKMVLLLLMTLGNEMY